MGAGVLLLQIGVHMSLFVPSHLCTMSFSSLWVLPLLWALASRFVGGAVMARSFSAGADQGTWISRSKPSFLARMTQADTRFEGIKVLGMTLSWLISVLWRRVHRKTKHRQYSLRHTWTGFLFAIWPSPRWVSAQHAMLKRMQ